MLRISLKKRKIIVKAISDAFRVSQKLNEPLPIPTLNFIGAQSSGKTTAISGILGVPMGFIDDKIGTRRPNFITTHKLKKNEQPYVTIGNDGVKYTDNNEISSKLEMLNALDKVSSKPIYTNVYHPDVYPMNLVDLPGLQLQSPDPNYPDMPQDIENMIKKNYINEKDIIASTHSAPVDRVASLGATFVNNIDKKGNRTIRLLTKIDLIELVKNNVLQDESQTYKLLTGKIYKKKFGTVGMGCFIDSDKNIDKAIKREYKILKENGYFEDNKIAELVGTENVRRIFSDIYIENIMNNYQNFRPNLVKYLQAITEECNMFKHISDKKLNDLMIREIEEILNIFHATSDERNDMQKNIMKTFENTLRGHLFDSYKHYNGEKINPSFKKINEISKYTTTLLTEEYHVFDEHDKYFNNNEDNYFKNMTIFGSGPTMDNYNKTNYKHMYSNYFRKIFDSSHYIKPELNELDIRKRRNNFCNKIDKTINKTVLNNIAEKLIQIFLNEIKISYSNLATNITSHQFFYYAINKIIKDKFDIYIEKQINGIVIKEKKPIIDPLDIIKNIPYNDGLINEENYFKDFNETYIYNDYLVKLSNSGIFHNYHYNQYNLYLFSDIHTLSHLKSISVKLSDDISRLLFSKIIDEIIHDTLSFTFDKLLSTKSVENEVKLKENEIVKLENVINVLDKYYDEYQQNE